MSAPSVPATLKPTPGTWRVVRGEMKGGKVALFIESEIPNLDGAPVACLGNPMMPFVEANASLFVAAPDMLALIEEMHEELAFGLAASYIGDLPEEVFDQLHDRLQRVDAVIKRAKGGGA